MQFLLFKPQLLTVLIPILYCQATDGYSPWSQYGYHQVKTTDTEGVLDNGRASIQVAYCLQDFYPLDKIYYYFKTYLPTKYKNVNVNYNVQSLPGKTKNGNEIIAVHITGPTNLKKNIIRKKIYIQCLIHAREWATGTACMCYTRIILNNYEKMTNGGKVENKYFERFQAVEFIIVPVVNPDGYKFTWTKPDLVGKPLTPRVWRVNCNPVCEYTKMPSGVDLNRNFDIYPKLALNDYLHYKNMYEQQKNDKSEWEDVYHQTYLDLNPGDPKNPEKETELLKNYILKNLPLAGLVDIHTAAQTIFYPETSNENDNAVYTRLSTNVAKAMSKNGQKFPFTIKKAIPKKETDKSKEKKLGGTLFQWTSSISENYKKQTTRIWSIAMELRNHVNNPHVYQKFIPPKEQLPDIFGDAARGLQAFIRKVLDWPEYQ